MPTPQTDAEWLDLLRKLNPVGAEPEMVDDPERVRALVWWDTGVDVGAEFGLTEPLPGMRREPVEPPDLVTLVAGDFAAEVFAIWPGDALAHYLLAADRQRHAWHCWLASPRGARMRAAGVDRNRLRAYLAGSKARVLLRDAYGVAAPGLVTALGKCGTKARSRDFYPALVQVLARQDLGAKHIRHAREFSDVTVISIAALPTALQSKPFFAKIDDFDEHHFAQACWTLKRLADLGQPDAIERVLRHGEPMVALSEAVAAVDFPPPPWPGTDLLRPIQSAKALLAAGERLKNCLSEDYATYAIKVVNRTHYYYEWAGNEIGIVTVKAIPPLGWTIEEGLGRDNNNLGPATWTQIQAALSTWGDLAPLWVSRTGMVHGASFFRHQLF